MRDATWVVGSISIQWPIALDKDSTVVTDEGDLRADKRLALCLDLKAKHKIPIHANIAHYYPTLTNDVASPLRFCLLMCHVK